MANLLSLWFPFSSGASSFPRQATDDDVLRASIIQILTTGTNERVMRAAFGNNIWDLVFENDSETYENSIEREVRSALGQWEPRISVDGVDIDTNDGSNEPGETVVIVYYTSLLTGTSTSISVAG